MLFFVCCCCCWLLLFCVFIFKWNQRKEENWNKYFDSMIDYKQLSIQQDQQINNWMNSMCDLVYQGCWCSNSKSWVDLISLHSDRVFVLWYVYYYVCTSQCFGFYLNFSIFKVFNKFFFSCLFLSLTLSL